MLSIPTFCSAAGPVCFRRSSGRTNLRCKPVCASRGRDSLFRGAPYHPQTQGKIERWHQTLKNQILLDNYDLPGDLEAELDAFVEHDNHRRYHESLNNLTPADVYFGRGQTILLERERIKRKTIEHQRLRHRHAAARLCVIGFIGSTIWVPMGWLIVEAQSASAA